jgi:hypothetical protein
VLLERLPRANIAGVVTNDMRARGRGGQKKYGYYGYSARATPRGGPEESVSLLDFDELARE